MMTLFFELDPLECVLSSPCARFSILHATLCRGQISTWGGGAGKRVGRSEPAGSFIILCELSLALDVTPEL